MPTLLPDLFLHPNLISGAPNVVTNENANTKGLAGSDAVSSNKVSGYLARKLYYFKNSTNDPHEYLLHFDGQ